MPELVTTFTSNGLDVITTQPEMLEKEEMELTDPMPFNSQEKTLLTPPPTLGSLKIQERSCSKMPDSDSEWLNSTKPTA
jgi:hypothetical protein